MAAVPAASSKERRRGSRVKASGSAFHCTAPAEAESLSPASMYRFFQVSSSFRIPKMRRRIPESSRGLFTTTIFNVVTSFMLTLRSLLPLTRCGTSQKNQAKGGQNHHQPQGKHQRQQHSRSKTNTSQRDTGRTGTFASFHLSFLPSDSCWGSAFGNRLVSLYVGRRKEFISPANTIAFQINYVNNLVESVEKLE